MSTHLVIHGHFYQPPRENPWTGHVDREPSAQPFANWNERVHAESYRPNAFARVLDQYGRIERIVCNYELISFNFGPTLMSWMEQHQPRTYGRVVAADRLSAQRRGGHGNAIAQAYNHTILPLGSERDQRTQIRWGIADFQHRFGRAPEALWLPETACSDTTLGALIDEGLRYTILSPHQAERTRPLGGTDWVSVADGRIDPGVPYRYFHRDRSGRFIDLFFYDGPISRAIAFEGLLSSSHALIDRFGHAPGGDGRLVHVATDGESYGHHFRRGERGLAYALEEVAPARGFQVTNYGEFLDHHPPVDEVEIKAGPDGEGTAWSCAHGVGRWIRDCGCHTGGQGGWNQAWRGPLRAALDLIHDKAATYFEGVTEGILLSPWAARDDYIRVILDPRNARQPFFQEHSRGALREVDQVRALTALEMQRHAMLMYTSCGWFFNDLSGIETVQVLKYAARVLDLMEELDIDPPRATFLETLAEAYSNIPEVGSGADIYRRLVEPSRVTPSGIAASLALSSLVEEVQDQGLTAGYLYRSADFRKEGHGRLTLVTARLLLESACTGKILRFAVAAIYFGGVDFYSVLQVFPGAARFKHATEQLWKTFRASSLPTILRVAEREFGPDEYGLEHLLPEARARISERVFGELVGRFTDQYARLYQENRRIIEMLQEAGFELPPELRAAAEFTLGRRFEQEIRRQHLSRDPAAYHDALEIAEDVARRGLDIDRSEATRIFGEMLTEAVLAAIPDPTTERLEVALSLLDLMQQLGIHAHLERAQEAIAEGLAPGESVSPQLRQLTKRLGLAPDEVEPPVVCTSDDPTSEETA